ncbi:EscE/YscE/SsaE family type III secretion system needle protein co-chaperone [Yersinia bercovieri]|uniref:EscE/YscE/SsaE family type III secretion system needle protein co-chaperone n=2 Tax=Yersinia bercovieri TaxID=634 RepID=A0A2G4U061_YERBE|nr:EscE/YscE/SsaE family type III secretion system needle protein co-chaperone [Yersinia bercovieri]EEQ05381.1 Type III secretion apparatus [Yersinia bercovieri ATCC 43970]MCB5303671.1 EscE/YscE/SsaE family type III secretion system needle protein co-chaperone [Yersinia bercovieri]PHZ26614.1 EscE/YscE/SsaE family type III secretion system needle protein co-chaperone [Yersinia bercovieri]QKJ06822.1 EscE/YscE/SsaE family type III secretion system needle protein co-chaperone [Yersinia bercovieri A
MQHITELEDDIKSHSKNIQQKKELLRKEKLIIDYQLSLQQTPDNYKYLNNVKLALDSAEIIIDTLSIRYNN